MKYLQNSVKVPFERLFMFLILVMFAPAATEMTGQHAVAPTTNLSEDEKIQVSDQPFFVYHDGEFREAILSKEPELIGGKELMETLIRLNIRYPDVAKEKKIGGTVLVSVVIDSLGQMEDVFIHEGVGGGCNDEALRAVKLMKKVGFEPGEMDGRPVTVKFDIPITFLPQ